jgi:transcriptional regulator with XRE-family HTH domain
MISTVEVSSTSEPTFGHWVRQQRKQMDLTQALLARRVGCAEATIKKIEAGLRRPSRQIAQLIVSQFEVAPEHSASLIELARQPAITHKRVLHRMNPSDVEQLIPLSPAALLGRSGELSTLTAMVLDPSVRLVSITGPPGVGKSRLALQVVEHSQKRFENGGVFVGLRNMKDPAEMLVAISRTVGLGEVSCDVVIDHLVGVFGNTETLLVLDNIEQLVGAVPFLERLLASCARLSLLVTTDNVLGMYCEQVFRVQPLPLPKIDGTLDLDALGKTPAIALFVARALAADSAFVLDQNNAVAVAELCVALDGLPLAIELAAERSAALSPFELLDDAYHRHSLLSTGGSISGCDRLCQSVERSFRALSPTEQTLFLSLSRFSDSFTIECAEIGAGTLRNWPEISYEDLRSGLLSLVQRSLLIRERSGAATSKFRMLKPIRDRAGSCLTDQCHHT